MSEAAGREQMERRLVEKSLQDDTFKRRLLEDPKAAVEEELGTRLPEEVRVVAMEETADTAYLVLPFRSTESREAGGWLEVPPRGVSYRMRRVLSAPAS